MNKSKLVSYLFVLLGILVMIGSLYLIMSYATDLFRSVVDFVTTNDFTKLQQCGVTPPPEFSKIKADFVTLIMPFMYIGLPLIMIAVSVLLFLAGFYYHKARDEEERKKNVELKREMVHKIVKKMGAARPAAPSMDEPSGPEAPPPEEPAEEAAPAEEEEPSEEEEEMPPLPPPKSVRKRK